jgi:aspartate aminotransferase
MPDFSSRIRSVEPSPTLSISSQAKAMKADGIDVLSFSAGEPDFNTPAPVREAAAEALEAGHTNYTPTPGIPELREAIAEDYARRGRSVAPENVVVTVGAKQALYNASQVLFESGDKVVLPAPHWVSYPAQVKLAEADPVSVTCPISQDFKLEPEQLDKQLSNTDVKGLVLCSPSNPTGAVYSEQELTELGEVLKKHEDVSVLFDAIYDRIFYEDADFAPDLVDLVPELENRTLTFNGFSKTYAMTGWRLGYVIAETDTADQLSKIQSHSTSGANSFAQHGAVEALKLDDSVIEDFREAFEKRRDIFVDGLRAIDGIDVNEPGGAFYVFPDFSEFIGDRFADDMELCEHLLQEAHVASVPGSAFGTAGYLRFSYACNEETIREGLERLEQAL